MNSKIHYRKGYKYQLASSYCIIVGPELYPRVAIKTEFIELTTDGVLLIKRGYAWDGPSPPAIDTLNFMRGSLVHDAFYQLIREKLLSPNKKESADALLQTICKQDGMSSIRAAWVWWGVDNFAAPAINPANDKKVITAP